MTHEHDNINPPVFPATVHYAHAYVPFQQWSGDLYSPMKALFVGTVFPELNHPYHHPHNIHPHERRAH